MQRALVISAESMDPSLRDIELSTTGLMFFGVPDTSREPEELALIIIYKMAQFSAYRPRLDPHEEEDIQNDLKRFTKEMEAFKPIKSQLETFAFLETPKTSFRAFHMDSSHSSLVSHVKLL